MFVVVDTSCVDEDDSSNCFMDNNCNKNVNDDVNYVMKLLCNGCKISHVYEKWLCCSSCSDNSSYGRWL